MLEEMSPPCLGRPNLVALVALLVAHVGLAAGCGESTRGAPVVPVETIVVPQATAPAQPPAPLPPPDPPKPTPGPTTILVPIEDGPAPPSISPWAAPSTHAGCAPFDRSAAASALASVNVQACARPGGIRGSGHVKLTYAPSGHVVAVTVDAGPFPGTPEGTCIATMSRAAQVPAFCTSAPVAIGKTFALN
jgi:hypothetical protein